MTRSNLDSDRLVGRLPAKGLLAHKAGPARRRITRLWLVTLVKRANKDMLLLRSVRHRLVGAVAHPGPAASLAPIHPNCPSCLPQTAPVKAAGGKADEIAETLCGGETADIIDI